MQQAPGQSHLLAAPPVGQDMSRMVPLTCAAFCSGSQALAGRGRASARGAPPTSASPLGPNACNTLQSAKRAARVTCLLSTCSHPMSFGLLRDWSTRSSTSPVVVQLIPQPQRPNLLEGVGCATNCKCGLEHSAVARRRAGLPQRLQQQRGAACVELYGASTNGGAAACAFQRLPRPNTPVWRPRPVRSCSSPGTSP